MSCGNKKNLGFVLNGRGSCVVWTLCYTTMRGEFGGGEGGGMVEGMCVMEYRLAIAGIH